VRHGHLPEREIITGIGQWRCAVHVYVIALAKARSASTFRRPFCRPTRVARRASRC
jgi:hypothetical protein